MTFSFLRNVLDLEGSDFKQVIPEIYFRTLVCIPINSGKTKKSFS